MRFARKEKNWYFLFNKRFNSYGPMRDALSVVLARTEELEADRISLDLAGGKHFAHALVGATAKNILLSEVIMPDLFARVAEDANPPAFFTEISESLRAGIGFEHGEELLSGLRAEVTASTSPSFAAIDRLAAVGAALALPPPVEVTAAEHFLGPHLPALVAQMDRTWQEASLDSWRSRHAYVVASTARLEALAALARERALSIDEAWERARITIEFQEPAEAIDRLQDTLEIDPHHPLANFTLGRILLERGDDTGIRHIDHAMDIDPLAEAPGCEIILEFLRHYERFDETEPYEERLDATRERGELAAAERKTISLHDHYAAHDLAPAAVEGLRDQLSGFPQVTEAYLVKKDVNHSPHQRLYVLGIVRGRWYHIQSRLGDVKLRRKLHKSLRIPDQFFVVILNDDNVHFMRKLRHIPNSRIL
jgi:tetratricopeptide (TPR) repeat protein